MGDAVPIWPDSIDDVFAGDLTVALADITPLHGVVVTPLTNFGLHDRSDNTITFLSSLGAWRKLARIRANPMIALAFHTRAHGFARGSQYVLVQGTASFSTTPDRDWLEAIDPQWERFMGPRDRGLPWERWMRVYQWERIGVRVKIHRILSWPGLDCAGPPTVHGAELPSIAPPPQSPPSGGTTARVDTKRVAHDVTSLPDTLLAWVGGDGFPMVVPVGGASATAEAIELHTSYDGLPAGGRRAGLTSHWFSSGVLGQEQRVHT